MLTQRRPNRLDKVLRVVTRRLAVVRAVEEEDFLLEGGGGADGGADAT